MEPLYQYVVVVGNTFGNKFIYGPFKGSTGTEAVNKALAWLKTAKEKIIGDRPHELVECYVP